MTAVVAVPDGNAAWVEVNEGGMDCGQPGGVGQTAGAEECCQDGLEAGVVGRRVPGVDVARGVGVAVL